MKESKDLVGIIPKNEYKPDLEKDVEYYHSIAEKPSFISKKIYTPNVYPTKFSDKREELDFQMEEIRRMIKGYDGLCGKGYGFLNYAKLRDPERGKVSPDFRVKQEEYFKKIETLQTTPGKGLVGFKRRRWGFTSIGAWDDWHDCATKPFYQIGANSKSENDSRKAFRHVKFIHQNVPDWMRPKATASDRRDFMEFAWYEKDPNGNRVKKGVQSWISVVAPVPQNHEGEAYSKLRIDEAGKIDCLMELWSLAEDCLRINTRRVGVPVILGTVGEISKEGKGLMEMYLNNDAYDLDRFAVYGYHGLIMDKYGNDLIEDAIRWIVYERYKMRSAAKRVREDFLQKYPLCEKDAFNQVSGGGVGDIQLINDQIVKLISEPPLQVSGVMRRKPDGGVDFVPNPAGKIIIYERPDHSRVNGYKGICDPIEDDDVKKSRDTSEIATIIGSKAYGLIPPRICAEFAYRPMKLDEYFEQAGMLCQWYNDTKLTIEMNKGGWRMRKYFEQHFPNLLDLAPVAATSAKGGVEWRIGVKKTAERTSQMEGLMEDYIDNHVKFIPSIKLLEQHKVFGDEHADDDLAVAWGWFLILVQSDKTVVKNKADAILKSPNLSWKKVGNTFQLVTPQGTHQGLSTPKPNKSALFG